MKIKQEDGTEIEVLSPEEAQAKVDEVTKVLEAKFAEERIKLEGERSRFESEKAALEAKLAGEDAGSTDFRALKDALDKKNAEIAALGQRIDESENNRIAGHKERLADLLSKGDTELKKKILHNFDETLKAVPAKTEADIAKKMQSALKLSEDTDQPSLLDFAGQGNSYGMPPRQGGNAVEFTPQQKALGAKFGLSDDDFKKYGPKIK